jgi:MoaA/NifB/PqqE/SkfB family radical SAM enzyme
MRACNNNCIRCFIEEQNLKEPYPGIFIYYENKIPVFSCDTDVRRITQEMIDEELKRAPFAYIRSNGRIFYYETIAKAISGLNNITVFLDHYSSNANIHDAITRTPKSHEQMVRGINNLLAFNTSLLVNYHVGNFRRDLKELADLGVSDVRLAVSDYPDIKNAFPVIKEAVQYCDELGLNVNVDKYPRELGFLLGKVFVGPDQIAITVNNICNHKCIFCTEEVNVLIDEKNPRQFRNLKNCDNFGSINPKVLKSVIDAGAKMRVREITISGGEPLLYPAIIETLEYIKSKGIEISLFTNGFMLNEKMSERFVNMGLDILQVNLSAFDDDSYKIQHNIDHASQLFAQILKQLKVLRQIKQRKNSATPSVEIVFVMTKHLFSHFEEMAELCSELGATTAFIKPLQAYKDVQRSALPTKEQVEDFNNNFDKYRKYFENIGIRDTLDDLRLALKMFSETGEYYKSSYEEVPCSTGWSYTQITPHAMVTSCCLMGQNVLGDLNNEKLTSIWLGRKYHAFRWATQDKAFMRQTMECKICPHYLFTNLPLYYNIKKLGLEKYINRRDSEKCATQAEVSVQIQV